MRTNNRFIPKKRTAIDGRVWWCVWDNQWHEYVKNFFAVDE